MKSFKDWSIQTKIFLIIFVTLAPLCGSVIFKVIPDIEEKLNTEKYAALKHVVESAYGILQAYDNKVQSGKMTFPEAEDQAMAEINSLRYSGKEYYFVYDMKGIVKALGSNPAKKGENRFDFDDGFGVKFVRDMIKVSLSKGEGFVKYHYPKLGEKEAAPKLSFVKYFKPWDCCIGSGIYIDDHENTINSMKNKIYILLIVVMLIAALTGWLIARRIIKPIRLLEASANKFTGGETNVRIEINSTDELGSLGNSFNHMISKISESMQTIVSEKAAAEQFARNLESLSEEARKKKEYLADNTRLLMTEMELFAEGDLTVQLIPPQEKDDIQKIFLGFNKVVEKISDMIRQVHQSVTSSLASSNEISLSTEQLAGGTSEQSQQTTEVASAVEELTKTIFETSQNITNVATLSRTTSQKAQAGVIKLAETKEGISNIVTSTNKTSRIITDLTAKTEQIGAIADVIDDIADQTNLLALNAAIEAARAGDQGRGFAVVADEVRKLAERTTKATKEISETIKSIQHEAHEAYKSMEEATRSVKTGTELTEQVTVSLGEILSGTVTLADSVNQIAVSSEEQSATAEQISKNVEGINNINLQAAQSAHQIASLTEDLNKRMIELENLVNMFKLNNMENLKAYGSLHPVSKPARRATF